MREPYQGRPATVSQEWLAPTLYLAEEGARVVALVPGKGLIQLPSQLTRPNNLLSQFALEVHIALPRAQ